MDYPSKFCVWPHFTNYVQWCREVTILWLFSFCRRSDPEFRDLRPQLKNKGDRYRLATLAECLLKESVQQGGVQRHNAVEDARTTMKLYLYDEGPWEASLDLGDADW